MRIRYAYKLTFEDEHQSFVVLNHIKSEEEVKEMYSDKGCVKAEFHARVRTGFRLNEQGELVETGLTRKPVDAPSVAPAEPKAPKAKKSAKKAKAE